MSRVWASARAAVRAYSYPETVGRVAAVATPAGALGCGGFVFLVHVGGPPYGREKEYRLRFIAAQCAAAAAFGVGAGAALAVAHPLVALALPVVLVAQVLR